MTRLAWSFFHRDATIALSYRSAFIAGLLGNVLLLYIFYYIGQLISPGQNPALAPYGGSYLAFMLVGLALTDCVGVSLTTFGSQIREGQLTGTLEATLLSPVPLTLILLFSSLWAYFFSAIRFLLYLGVGSVLYGVQLGNADLLSAIVIFALTVVSFAGIGIGWASVILLVKRGEAILTTISVVVILISGVVFPRSLMPGWMQQLAEFVPLTHALDGMRLALLRGDGMVELSGTMVRLSLFAVTLMITGVVAFSSAVALSKRTGSLVEY
jgi:ABC-2 type transport system permease protein